MRVRLRTSVSAALAYRSSMSATIRHAFLCPLLEVLVLRGAPLFCCRPVLMPSIWTERGRCSHLWRRPSRFSTTRLPTWTTRRAMCSAQWPELHRSSAAPSHARLRSPSPCVLACPLALVFAPVGRCLLCSCHRIYITQLRLRASPRRSFMSSRGQVPEMDVVMTHAVGHMNTDRAWSRPGRPLRARHLERTCLKMLLFRTAIHGDKGGLTRGCAGEEDTAAAAAAADKRVGRRPVDEADKHAHMHVTVTIQVDGPLSMRSLWLLQRVKDCVVVAILRPPLHLDRELPCKSGRLAFLSACHPDDIHVHAGADFCAQDGRPGAGCVGAVPPPCLHFATAKLDGCFGC